MVQGEPEPASIYARPANSGPGRTFIMGLPYILGDKNPKDPVNGWDKTWAYLKELNSCIEYYPTGTGAVMKELGEGSRDMTRDDDRLGHQPAHARHRAEGLQGRAVQGHDVGQRRALHGRCRRASPPEKLAVVLDLMAYLLTPEAQALHLRQGLLLSRARR